MQLVSKIFNLCASDPPTLQTGGQTDDMQSLHRALDYSASRGKNSVQKPSVCFDLFESFASVVFVPFCSTSRFIPLHIF